MKRLLHSDRFPEVMRPNAKKNGFTHRVKLRTLIKLDSKYSTEEVEGDGAEIIDIEILTIDREFSFGEVLELIERDNAEPASITQFMGSSLMQMAEESGWRVVALRHSILIDEEECNFYYDSDTGFALHRVNETGSFEAGCMFVIIRRKPMGIPAAA